MSEKKRPAAVELTNRKVIKIMHFTENYEDRVILTLEGEPFDSFDEKGTKVKTNNIGLNTRNLIQMVAPFSDYIQLADALAMGNAINEQIISLALTNATINVTREYKFKGEEREQLAKDGTKQVYSNDCWKSTITSGKCNVSPLFANHLALLLQNPIKMKKVETVLNPFNI